MDGSLLQLSKGLTVLIKLWYKTMLRSGKCVKLIKTSSSVLAEFRHCDQKKWLLSSMWLCVRCLRFFWEHPHTSSSPANLVLLSFSKYPLLMFYSSQVCNCLIQARLTLSTRFRSDVFFFFFLCGWLLTWERRGLRLFNQACWACRFDVCCLCV